MTKTFYWNAWGRTEKDIRLNKYLHVDEQLQNKIAYPKEQLDAFQIQKGLDNQAWTTYKGRSAQKITKEGFSRNASIKITADNIEQFKNN